MKHIEEGLVLETAWDLSINDLLTEQAAGRSVLRTPHVGNMPVHNMALLDAGIPAWLVDYAVADKDPDYRAETVLQDGESTDIACAEGRLTCRAKTEEGTEVWLDKYHLAGLTEALPNAHLETYTDYVRRHETVAGETFSILARQFPDSFTHQVTADGLRMRTAAKEDVHSQDIMQLADDHRSGEALLPSNTHNLLATFVIEALESGADIQYHVSGSSLFKYAFANRTAEQLDRMYRTVRAEATFGAKLPRALQVMIVPARAAVWATTDHRRESMDALIAATEEHREGVELLEAERRSVFGPEGTAAMKEAFLSQVKERRHEIHLELLEVLCEQPEVIADRATDAFVTQYDVADEGGLYVAEQNRTMTMRDLAQLHIVLHDVAKSKSGRESLRSSHALAR